MNKLFAIQQELKAPKNQFNDYGKYAYRSAESILEALKPLLNKHEATILLTDELVNIGERYYIKATVRLSDENGLIAETTAFAREEETKKGMDGSQITGASSSYARKYALNGMFAIDDVADSDKTNTHGKEKSEPKAEPKTEEEKPICPVCNKPTTAKALEVWGMCSNCKKQGANNG